MKSIIDQMIEAGYRRFERSSYQHQAILCMYQKMYKDQYGIKYFITCEVSNMSLYTHKEEKDNYSFHSQLITFEEDTFDVNLSGYYEKNEWNHLVRNLKNVEDFFENIFISTKAKHYGLDNDIKTIDYKIKRKLKKTL